MNPVAPVTMLTGRGSGKAIVVFAALLGLALYAAARSAPPAPNQPGAKR